MCFWKSKLNLTVRIMKYISEERARLYAELEISEEKIRRTTAQLSDENEKETLDKVTALMLERMQLRKNLEDLWRKEERADHGSSDKFENENV